MTGNEDTTGVAATAAVPAMAMAGDDDAPTGARCGNCGAALRGPHCHRCGQPVKGLVRHFSTFIGDAVDTVFDLDSRTPRTLWPLFAKPGYLTQEYFAGRRVRYVSPVRLFYLLAILAFFVGSLVVSFGEGEQGGEISNAVTVPEVERIRTGVLRDLERTRAGLPKQPGADAGVIAAEAKVRALAAARIAEIRAAEEKGVPVDVDSPPFDWDAAEDPVQVAWLPDFANRWLTRQATRTVANIVQLREDPEPFKARLMGAVPIALSLMLPVFALLLKFAYAFRKRLYMEHLIVALHSHAFICLSLLLLFLLSALRDATAAGFVYGLAGWLEGGLWIWMLLYLLLMQKRVYGQGWVMTLVKYCVLGNIYFVMLGVFAGGAALASLVWM